MDPEVARWLVSADAVAELELAAAHPTPDSLAAAEALRCRLNPEKAAAVSEQVALRRQARAKFGEPASGMFFTRVGLEQATRLGVARWRAGRLAAAGAVRVLDLGCGLGADALAFAEAGLDVVAVEADEVTAIFAAANLRREVIHGDAVDLLNHLDNPGTAVFCDPGRRSAAGRSWRVEDLSPPWSFVERVLDRPLGVVKLGPGAPYALIPDDAAATWVSDHGDLVELSLWSGRTQWSVEAPGSRADAASAPREAVLLPAGGVLAGEAIGRPFAEPIAPLGESAGWVGRTLYEPDPAVIRARLVDPLAGRLGAHRVHPGIAYLIAPEFTSTAFATAFEITQVLDAGERTLRSWVREHGIGTLEIKKRGVDVDPAVLRRRLKPRGSRSATIVLTPTAHGVRALVVRRG